MPARSCTNALALGGAIRLWYIVHEYVIEDDLVVDAARSGRHAGGQAVPREPFDRSLHAPLLAFVQVRVHNEGDEGEDPEQEPEDAGEPVADAREEHG